MANANQLWTWWQSLVQPFQAVFTRPGWVRFVQWCTGMILCGEEHTITQILTTLGLESRWRALEYFAELGAFDRPAVERQTLRIIEQQQPPRWGRYHPTALDDTKLHRTSKGVWGTCTYHEPAGRSPNRASTVRAHNWVVLGSLVPGQPWTYLPHAARLYFRTSQVPHRETFRTKTQWAVELFRQADAESAAPILAVCDGAYATRTVIRPCLNPPPGGRRIEVVTRLREDARLYRPLVPQAKTKGRPRRWGRRWAAPKHHEKWDVPWQDGEAYIYGRMRKFQYKQTAVSGRSVARRSRWTCMCSKSRAMRSRGFS